MRRFLLFCSFSWFCQRVFAFRSKSSRFLPVSKAFPTIHVLCADRENNRKSPPSAPYARLTRALPTLPAPCRVSRSVLYLQFQIRGDKAVQIAVHDRVDVAHFVIRAVILDKRIGHKDVGAYLAAPGDFLLHALDVVDVVQVLLLGDFHQLGAQHTHGGVPVLELAAFRLAGDDYACGNMRDSDCGLGLVDVLAARTAAAVCIDLQILGSDFNVELVADFGPALHFLYFR